MPACLSDVWKTQEQKWGPTLNYCNMFCNIGTEPRLINAHLWRIMLKWNLKVLQNRFDSGNGPFISSWDLLMSNLRALRKRSSRESGLLPKRSCTSLARSSPSAALSFIIALRSFTDDARLSSVSFSSSLALGKHTKRHQQDKQSRGFSACPRALLIFTFCTVWPGSLVQGPNTDPWSFTVRCSSLDLMACSSSDTIR